MRVGQEAVMLEPAHYDARVDLEFPRECVDPVSGKEIAGGNESFVTRARNECIGREDIGFLLTVAFFTGRGIHEDALVLVQ